MAGDGIRLGGAWYELTIDDAKLIQGLARSQSQAKSFSDAIAKSMSSASSTTDNAMKSMARSTEQANTGFANLSKSALAFGVAALGVQSAAAIVHNGLMSIVESTKAAQQAQFALSKAYGTSTPEMIAFSKQFADEIGRSNTEVQKAAVSMAVLTRSYGLNAEQAKELVRITADLAAASGQTLAQSATDIQGAIRGEAEASEKLGVVLNETRVATNQLGADGQKLWETLTEEEKATLRLLELMQQLADRKGAAAEQADTAAGAFNRLAKATDELGVTIGENLIGPAATAADALATTAKQADEVIRALSELQNLDLGKLEQIATFLFAPFAVAIAGAFGAKPPWEVNPPGGGAPGRSGRPDVGGPAFGPSPGTVKTIQDALAIEAKARRRLELEEADKANKAATEAAIKALDAERRAKEQWFDEEKRRIDARRAHQLEDIETRKQATLDALAAEKQATLDAIDEQIAQQERLKQAQLDAAEAAADAARTAIEARKQQLALERELEDRQRSDQRQSEDRALEDARRREDRSREQRQKDEIEGLQKLTEARQEAVEKGIAALEKATDRRIRALDREADRARANGQQALTQLERQGEQEDELHRQRMQALDDEKDARLEILDAQLKALDAEEHAADAGRRTADIQKRVADAQLAQSKARGTGTPAQVAEAREELTRALRGGDERSIANARDRLVDLAGQGNAAIKKADEDLAAAQQDLRDEGVDEARDAEREKLKAAQDAVNEEIDARSRAEEDADRVRKHDLELAQENERARLQATLDRISGQKQAEQEASDGRVQRLKKQLEDAQKAADEQVRITRLRFEQEGDALVDARLEEDRLRHDTRQQEDRERADAREAQDRDLARQLAAISSTLEAERTETEAHYNGPNGIITQLKAARTASEREYAARLQAVQRSYEAERKAAELLYHNPEGTGELDLLAQQRAAEMQALADRRDEYQEQARLHHEMIEQMVADLKKLNTASSSGGGGGGGGGAGARSAPAGDLVAATRAAAAGAGLDQDIFERQIKQESNFNPNARSSAGALGIAQFMPGTAKARGLKNPLDPIASLDTAAKYMAEMEKKYEGFDGRAGIVNALWAYNAGEGNLKKGILPSETLHYLNTILKGKYGFDRGGMIREPVMGTGLRSGRPYAIAEYGPEYVLGRRATSMLGPGPASSSAGLGGFLAASHPGGAGGVNIVEGDVNVSGIGLAEVAAEIERRQHRQRLLRSAVRL